MSFITLEAFQAVYLGSVFQDVDAFLIGPWIFGITLVGTALATIIFRPMELTVSMRSKGLVAALNLFAAITWIAYFIAIQLIESAVVFTIF